MLDNTQLAGSSQISQAGPSKMSQIASRVEHQTNIKSSNADKIVDNNTFSSGKKRSYEELYSDNTSNSRKKRSYDELFGNISNFLERDISMSGTIINW